MADEQFNSLKAPSSIWGSAGRALEKAGHSGEDGRQLITTDCLSAVPLTVDL